MIGIGPMELVAVLLYLLPLVALIYFVRLGLRLIAAMERIASALERIASKEP